MKGLKYGWIIVCMLCITFFAPVCMVQGMTPENISKGLIAEAVSEGYEGMYAVACAVRNRIENGKNTGLCGLKRKDLDAFVKRQGIKYEVMADEIVDRVFNKGSKDVTKGATLFENIEAFGFPKSWDKSKVEKTVKIGSHTFFREIDRRMNEAKEMRYAA